MRIEILYPQLCCLYGDKGNTLFLQRCFPEAEFIYTALNDAPAFLAGDVDLCYMASMSEQSQERILERLLPHRERIAALMEAGRCLFLFTGTALELLGRYIQREDGTKAEGLGIFETYAVRQAPHRFNTLVRAKRGGMTLLGYTSRFAHTYGITGDTALAVCDIGCGGDPETKLEGLCRGQVVATYLLGPVLVLNPDFAKELLGRLGYEGTLPFEAELYAAHARQAEEYTRPDLEMD